MMTLSERIAALENPVTREMFQGLYDAWAEALTIPNDLLPERYHGSMNGRGLDSGIVAEGERFGGSTIARINILQTLYLEFPEMGDKIAQNAGVNEIRRILENKRNERQDEIDDEMLMRDLEHRLLINEELASRGSELHLHFSVDYAARDRNYETFGALIDKLQDPDTPELSGK